MYKKVKVIFYTDPNGTDDFSDTYSVEYENCTIDVKGNYFIIQVFKNTEIDGEHDRSIDGYVYNLNVIKSYKAKY